MIIDQVRGLLVLENTPGILSLLAGKPNSSTFPIRSISMNVRSPAPPFTESTITIDGNRIDEALQYGQTIGHPDLVKFLIEMQTELHGRPKNPSWRVSIGAGSQDLLYKAFQTLTDPGDVVLIEVSKSKQTIFLM
jgi:tryptophan aminotransferase